MSRRSFLDLFTALERTACAALVCALIVCITPAAAAPVQPAPMSKPTPVMQAQPQAGLGVERWSKFWITASGDGIDPIATAADAAGNIYVTGTAGNLPYTFSLTVNGGVRWGMRLPGYAGAEPGAITVDGDRNVYVSGTIWNGTHLELLTVSYTGNGTQRWVRRKAIAGGDLYPTGIAVDSMRNLYITGYVHTSTGSYQLLTISYTGGGAERWTRTKIGPAGFPNLLGDRIAIDSNRNVYVTGSADHCSGCPSSSRMLLISYTGGGVERWAKYEASTGQQGEHTVGNAITIDGANNITIAGWTDDSIAQVMTVSYKGSGVQRWKRTYRSFEWWGRGYAIVSDDDGNVYVASHGDSAYEVRLLSYTRNGALRWMRALFGLNVESYDKSVLAVDPARNVYLTGLHEDLTTNKHPTVSYTGGGALRFRYDAPVSPNQVHNTLTATVLDVGKVLVMGYSDSDSAWTARLGAGNRGPNIVSGVINIPLLATFDGSTFDFARGQFGTYDGSRTDNVNFYDFGGGNLGVYWYGGSGAGVVDAAGEFAVLRSGAVVGPSRNFSSDNDYLWNWWGGANGYLGVRFRNSQTGVLNYGYIRLTTTGPSGFPAKALEYAYDKSGAAIVVP